MSKDDTARRVERRKAAIGKIGVSLLRRDEVEALLSVRHTWLEKAVARGEFPKPIKISDGGRAVAWISTEVEAYIRSRAAARDGEAA